MFPGISQEPCRLFCQWKLFESLFSKYHVGRVGSNPRPANYEKYGPMLYAP